MMTQILPWGFLFAALAKGNRSLTSFYLPLAHVLLSLGIRAALCVRFKQAIWATPTQPIGWLITLAIGANSAYLALSKRGHSWKGRVYTQ